MPSSPAHQSPLTERMVLSIMARDEAYRRRAMVDGLTEDHFLPYRPVFVAMRELSLAGSIVDPATLSARIEDAGLIDDIGGHRFVLDLFAETTDAKAWRQWVKDLGGAMAKRVMDDGLLLVAEAKTAEQQLQTMASVQEMVKAALAGPPRSKTAKEAVALAMEELLYLANAGGMPGIPTGIAELDEITGGMRKAQLWSILARTSRGKSVLMAQFVCSAIKEKKRSAIFSAEMLIAEVVFRSIAHRGKIDLGVIMNPRKAGKWLQNIKTQLELLAGEPLHIDDTPKMSLLHVERESMRIADENDGLDLIAVDYLQILKAERGRGMSREEAVAMLSGGLKQLAKTMGCPVITASQVNKEGNTRESEAIAFDSDVMLAIADDGIRVAKARNAKRDTVLPYTMIGEYQTFAFNPHAKSPDEAADGQADREAARKGGRDRQFKR